MLSDAYRVREAYSTSEGLRTRLEVVLGQARRAEAAEAAARQAAEQGRFREQSLRKAKEAVLTDLEVSHAATERQREIAEAALDESRSYLYLQRIALADLAYRDNDVLAAQRSLEQCAVELRNWEWHYLHGLCHAELGTFESGLAGDNELFNVSLHPDGKRFIAVTPQNATVWNLVTGQQDWLLPNSANERRRITCGEVHSQMEHTCSPVEHAGGLMSGVFNLAVSNDHSSSPPGSDSF